MDKESEVLDMNGASPLHKGLAVFFVIMSLLYTASPIDYVAFVHRIAHRLGP